jgi:hypothetical protein
MFFTQFRIQFLGTIKNKLENLFIFILKKGVRFQKGENLFGKGV